MHFVSYSVETKANPELVWQVFADWELWYRYSDWLGDISWTSGEPWQVGSRMEVEMIRPVHSHAHRRLQVSVPGKRLSWIDHILGTTFEEWVFFEPISIGATRNCTRVHVWAEFTGILSVVAGRPLKRVVQDFFLTWYNNFAAECDRRASNSAGAGK